MNKQLEIVIISTSPNLVVKTVVENYNVQGIVYSAPRNYHRFNFLQKFIFHSFLNVSSKSLKKFAAKHNIDFFLLHKKNKLEFKQWLLNKKPNLVIVKSMTQLLPADILQLPGIQFINIHTSLLPKYRGPNPLFWQYYNMEKVIGITVHYIDAGEDTGDIIYQEKIYIPYGIRLSTLKKIIEGVETKLMLKVLENIDNLPRIKQPKESPTIRARNLTPDEYKKIINWENCNVLKIWHVLRGNEDRISFLLGDKDFYNYEIRNFKKCDIKNKEIGRFRKESKKFYVLSCKDGKIFIRRRLSIKKLLKKFLFRGLL